MRLHTNARTAPQARAELVDPVIRLGRNKAETRSRSTAGAPAGLLGASMTFVLITRSWTVALAVHALRAGKSLRAAALLVASVSLGLVFLGLKAADYHGHLSDGAFPGRAYQFEKVPEPAANLFYTLYSLTTGLHALHVLVGVGLIGVCVWMIRSRRVDRRYSTPVELCGLYWHLVDIIWLFLRPLFYLMR